MILAIAAAILFLFAQVGTAPVTATFDPSNPDYNVLVQQALSALSDFKTGSTLAGLVVLTVILTNISKLRGVINVIPAKLRPWISLALGVISSSITVKANGGTWTASIVAGLMVGLSAIGAHEVVSSVKPSAASQAAASTTKAMIEALSKTDGSAHATVAALSANIAQVAKATDAKAAVDTTGPGTGPSL